MEQKELGCPRSQVKGEDPSLLERTCDAMGNENAQWLCLHHGRKDTALALTPIRFVPIDIVVVVVVIH